MPVTARDPSGTTTRAPAQGDMPSGTLYVSRSSAGTGTATLISNLTTSSQGRRRNQGHRWRSFLRGAARGSGAHGGLCLPLCPSRAKQIPNALHVVPDLALRGRVAQQVGGVKGRNQLGAAIVVHAAAQPRDRIERPQQRARREGAQRDDHFRLDDIDLLEQERLAGLDLVRLRVAIL